MDFIEPNFLSPTIYIELFVLLVIPFLWFIRTTKILLFYIYLWQLKEYHIGRFLDHFETEKGRQLILNKLLIIKFLLLFFPSPLLFGVVYTLEAFKTLVDWLRKRVKRPVLTIKTIILIGIGILLEILFVSILFLRVNEGHISSITYIKIFLLVDILTPVIVSAVVLVFQPFTVVARNRIVRQAKERRKRFRNLKVIGITGSYGKTTTKEFLSHILSKKFQVLKTPNHQNSEVGISNVILRSLTDVHNVFVCEMGAYNKGGIKLLADIAQPNIGIVTGVNEQHLATFGSMENLLSAEGGQELAAQLPKGGVIILNWDSEKIRNQISRLRQDFGGQAKLKKINSKVKKIVLCSTKEKKDIWAEDIKVEKECISFQAFSKHKEKANFKVNVLGAHNIENILLATAAAKEFGMSLKEIAKVCENISPDLGAMKLKKGIGGLNIVDSTYSANPDGVMAALEYLKIWKGKKVIVMPCLIELGKASKEVHKRIGAKIGEVCDLAIITTKECFQDLQEGAAAKGMRKENILFLENPQEIFEKIKSFRKEEDVVLLESRVPTELIRLLMG